MKYPMLNEHRDTVSLGVLARATFVDWWEFSLYLVFSLPQRCLILQLSSLVLSLSILPPPDPSSSHPHIQISSLIHKWWMSILLPFTVWFMHPLLSPPFYLASLHLWIIHGYHLLYSYYTFMSAYHVYLSGPELPHLGWSFLVLSICQQIPWCHCF